LRYVASPLQCNGGFCWKSTVHQALASRRGIIRLNACNSIFCRHLRLLSTLPSMHRGHFFPRHYSCVSMDSHSDQLPSRLLNQSSPSSLPHACKHPCALVDIQATPFMPSPGPSSPPSPKSAISELAGSCTVNSLHAS
jgi:hypothetical protein